MGKLDVDSNFYTLRLQRKSDANYSFIKIINKFIQQKYVTHNLISWRNYHKTADYSEFN